MRIDVMLDGMEIQWLDKLCAEWRGTRSAVVRQLIAIGNVCGKVSEKRCALGGPCGVLIAGLCRKVSQAKGKVE